MRGTKRVFSTALTLLLGVALTGEAWAACPSPYTTDQLLGDLGAVEDLLRAGDNAAVGKAAAGMEGRIGCLNEVLPAIIMGRTYRAIAAGLYVGGNQSRGQQWYRSAIVVDPTFDYGTEDLPAGHPAALAYIDVRAAGVGDPVPVENMELVSGQHFLDGRKIAAPAAQPNMPHVYQFKAGDQILPYLIEGNLFPSDVMAVSSAASDATVARETEPKEPKGKKPKEPVEGDDAVVVGGKEPKEGKGKTTTAAGADDVVTMARVRPAEKTPLMVGGGMVIAGAGGLFVAATGARNNFENAETLADLDQYQNVTNRLVLMSAVVMSVGAGTATWGAIIHDGALLPAIHVRF